MDENILEAISLLFYPVSRTEGVRRLKAAGVLDDAGGERLLEILEEGKYAYRALFRRIAPIKIELDRWVRQHQYNKFRPSAAIDMIRRYAQSEPRVLDRSWLAGKDVFDFGAGQFSPISVAIILYVNGARSITAFEPGGWYMEFVDVAVRELVAEMLMNPEPFDLVGLGDPDVIRKRLADVRLERLADADEVDLGPIRLARVFDFERHAAAFDLILSTSVFEHVESFDHEIGHHLNVLRQGGVSVNRVDFTDHRHMMPQFAPFGFYHDGVLAGCNLLRVSDLEAAAKKSGAMYEIKDRLMAEPDVLNGLELQERFRHYDRETLLTKSATFVLHR